MLKQRYFLWALPAVFALQLVFVIAQNPDQSGFISLDCGIPRNSNYLERTIGLNYTSDADFITTGTIHSVAEEYKIGNQEQVNNLRSFPDGIRNCYRINVKEKTRYLIRGLFFHGNYDGTNTVPQFDLHLGGNYWDTVSPRNVSIPDMKEIMHITTKNRLSVCLVNTGLGTPFITSLELRPMSDLVYYNNTLKSLNLVLRWDTGSNNAFSYRYPYDVIDRSWSTITWNTWSSFSTNETVDANSTTPYLPPSIVMSSTASPLNESEPLIIPWSARDMTTPYYYYLHIAELQLLKANESRAFNIILNDMVPYTLVPLYLKSRIIYNSFGTNGYMNYAIWMFKLPNSTLPPILNAIEIFEGLELSQVETSEDDVDAINKIKSSYRVNKISWDGDPCVPKAYLWKGLNCSYNSADPPRIISLDLSSSGLNGEISTHLSNLTSIETLDLSNNNLSGSVPKFLSLLPNLRVLNLERNNLSGSIPVDLSEKAKNGILHLRVGGNVHLCSSSECNETKRTKKKNNVLVPILASVGGLVVLLLLLVAILKKRRPESKPPNDPFGSVKRHYTYAEVQKITDGFNSLLGKGGFGEVYRGSVDKNTQVAVKVLSSSSRQGYDEFQAEVNLLMKVYHGNLTNLVGYCYEDPNMVLIYEYMENGDLESHLSGDGNKSILSWEERLQIAIDAAHGLEYLHSGCKPAIIHRDIKPANILLNQNFRAKLADFGLSRSYTTENDSHLSTVHIAGTTGYLDPTYRQTGLLTEKSDVYSFGVLILELITNRRPIQTTRHDPVEQIHLSKLIGMVISTGVITSVVDQGLQGDFDTNSAWKAVEIGLRCASQEPGNRPNMTEVVSELKESLKLELARKNKNLVVDSPSTMDIDELMMSNSESEFRPLAK